MSNIDTDSADYYSKLEGRQSVMGMTLRDYFAAKAMGGMVANVVRGHVSYGNTQDLAARSYEIADEMLAERAK